MKKFLRKFLKIVLWILGGIIGILLLLLLLIQIPAVQNYAKEEAISFLEGKFNTPVRVGNLDIDFPKKIVLEDFYLEDQEGDTLAAGERLAVNINFYKLVSNTFDIGAIELRGAVVHLKRDQDSVFNFDYMAEAFATDTPKDTTAAAMDISLGTIDFDNVRFRMNDQLTKTDIDANLNHLDTRIGTFDLENMIYEIPEITIDGLNLKMDQGITESATESISDPSETEAEEDTAPLNIGLGDISLSNIQVTFNSESANINSAFGLEELQAQFEEFKLQEQFVDLSNLEISGLKGKLIMPQTASAGETGTEAEADSTATTEASNNWKVKIDDADFQNIAFRYQDQNAPQQEQGINYMDLDLTNLNLNAENFYYSLDSLSGRINSFTLKDKSGLNIQSLETDFAYANTAAYLKNLYLETPNTLLRDKVVLDYQSLESLQENIGEASVVADLNNSKIGFHDILLFAPDLKDTPPFASNPDAVLNINGEVSGQVNDLKIDNFEASGIGNTVVAINGTISGLPDAENAYYNLNIREFRTTAADVKEFVPPGTIPDSIQIPETFSATGSFTGTTENFSTKVDLESSAGSAQIDAAVDMRRENAEFYRADVVMNSFDVGQLIQNDSLGTISLNVRVKGTGFDPKTASATAEGTIDRVEYNSYAYEDLAFEGTMEDGVFSAEASMDDPNLNFELAASGSFQGEYPSIELNADLINVALDSLNLYSYPLRLEGNIRADLTTADPDYLNGEIFITELIAENATDRFPLDTIAILSHASPTVDSLVLDSQFLDAKIEGDYQLTQLSTALTNTISKYYDLSPATDSLTAQIDTIAPQIVSFSVDIDNDPVLTQLMPQVEFREPVRITGGFNSVIDSLSLHAKVIKLRYLDYDLTNLDVDVVTEGDAILYEIVIDDVDSPQLQLFHTEITGKVEDNNVFYNLQIDDSKGNLHYRLAGLMEAYGDSKRISLEIENLILNYDRWRIPEDNSITIAPAGVQATNFELVHNNQAIRVNSESQDPASPMNIVFDNFKLETISAMVSKDTLLAGGTLNGEVLLDDLTSSPTFRSDLTVENFTFKRDTVGDLRIEIDNEAANLLATTVTISGNGNNVVLAGTYNTENESLDMVLNLEKLMIESIQGFSLGNISQGEGFLSGELNIEGTVGDPDITGVIDFNEVAFVVTPLDNYFQGMNDQIVFNSEGMRFDTFTLSDENENKLVVDGSIATTDYTNFAFDLTAKANDFKAISSTVDNNEFYYGTLILDTNLEIEGTMESPVIGGSIDINEGTDLTVVLPQEDPSIADREGVVEFVDETSQRLAEMEEIEATVNSAAVQGMDILVNIDINDEAEFTMIIDQGNGDFLSLKGEANLTAGIDPSGNVSLSGRYEFTEGAYEMSFNFIRRRFEIEEDSYILWTGEPTEATIDITAIYETETAPIDLLGNQLAGLTQAARNTYKQEIPFEVLLNMTGELLEPELSFNIRIPEGNYNVSSEIINSSRAKLAQLRQQPSELNKQVFALLLLNRFIGENPFSSSAGGTSAESLARQSVSKILSQQLNDLAGDLISGVELDFNLESIDDYTTGQLEQKTDLNVGLSKRLLNDRLKVTVGSSFGLEGPVQENQKANNIAGDVAVEYQLSKDGRYILRAYRKNEYEVALQGQIVETGVAFIITLDYDRFMEIFGKKPDEKEDEN